MLCNRASWKTATLLTAICVTALSLCGYAIAADAPAVDPAAAATPADATAPPADTVPEAPAAPPVVAADPKPVTPAQQPDVVVEPPSLKGQAPVAPDVSEYIADLSAAQQLGKALFWDTQVGSDGNACASCHFHAGADIRTKHEVDPGVKAGDSIFNLKASGGTSGPNKQFSAADWPFHKLADTTDRESAVSFDTNDVFSSLGTFAGDFVSSRRPVRGPISAKIAARKILSPKVLAAVARFIRGDTAPGATLRTSEACSLTYNPYNPETGLGNAFHSGGMIYRKVEPRQTPTTVNAVFNRRQFWDGRASNEFNGVDPFGARTYQPVLTVNGVSVGNPAAPGAGIFVLNSAATAKAAVAVSLVQPVIRNASLASQAVGPPLSDFEMSCAGKSFADLGRKILPMRALSTQVIDPNDSLFSKTPKLVNTVAIPGLNTTYADLVKKAFKAKYWSAPGNYIVDPATGTITRTPAGDAQIERNFSLFWGLALQAYESLLISDDAPYDRGAAAMTAEALKGKDLFMGKGKCVSCHNGPLFTSAAITTTSSSDASKAVEGMLMGDGRAAIYDNGFYNIGVRPAAEDRGVGALDPYGFDLSYTRQYKWRLLGAGELAPDRFDPNPCAFEQQLFDCNSPPRLTEPTTAPRDAVDGAFKVPTLRNVGLTPPYFHNGGQATLKDVVRFYNRGGDRRGKLGEDTTGLAETTRFGVVNKSNLDADIGDASNTSRNNALGLSETEMDNIVSFLLSLTDQRVACHSGVFDHPALPLVVGHLDAKKAGTLRAKDVVVTLPAVGKNGLTNCFPNSGNLFGSLQTSFGQIAK